MRAQKNKYYFMKNAFLALITLILLSSCNSKSKNFTLNGQVNGLKKGTLYLQYVKDSTLVTLDSVLVNGNAKFSMSAHLDAPEMLYLTLDKKDLEENIIPFFAAEGITEIETSLKNFYVDAKIKGSGQQELLKDYLGTMTKFNDTNLELIKDNLEAQKALDTIKIRETQKAYDNLLKRKYLYTINFAMTHKDNEIAPYLALTEIYDAQIKYLDTINNALTKEIKDSKYGKELQKYIDQRKAE